MIGSAAIFFNNLLSFGGRPLLTCKWRAFLDGEPVFVSSFGSPSNTRGRNSFHGQWTRGKEEADTAIRSSSYKCRLVNHVLTIPRSDRWTKECFINAMSSSSWIKEYWRASHCDAIVGWICGSPRITGSWIQRAPIKGIWWHLNVGSLVFSAISSFLWT